MDLAVLPLRERVRELEDIVQRALTQLNEGNPLAARLTLAAGMGEMGRWGTWTAERIQAQARAWNERFGRPPSRGDWDAGQLKKETRDPAELERRLSVLLEDDWPSPRTVARYFPSWTAMLASVGMTQNAPVPRGDTSAQDFDKLPVWNGWTLVHPFRQRVGLSQAVIAQRSGLSVNYVSGLETGRVTNPTVRVVLALSHALNVRAAALIEQTQPKEQR